MPPIPATDADGNPIVEKTAEQLEAERLFDAAVEHVETNTHQPFTEEAAATADAAVKARDDAGRFTKTEDAALDPGKKTPEPVQQDDAAKKAAEAAAAAEAAKATANADTEKLLASLPAESRDAVKKILDDTQRQVSEATTNAKRHQQQVAGYERKLSDARTALAAAQKANDPVALAKANAEAVKAKESIEALKKDFPNIAEALEAVAKVTEERVRTELGGQIAALQKQVQPLHQTAVTDAKAVEEAAIAEVHKDWREEVKTPQFLTWYGKQSDHVKALAKGDVGAEVALFDLYRVAHPRESAEQIAAREKAAQERTAADALAAKRAQQQRDAAGPAGKRTVAPVKTNAETSEADKAAALFDQAVQQVQREFRIA